jgi:ribonuclease BN (tRNA processing enzyme)
VKLTVVGCSPAWPNPGGAQSGYLVEGTAAEGTARLLLDCGPGVLARLRTQEPWPLVDAIVLTHFHLDHWGDLVPWVFGASFGAGRGVKQPQLWVPPGGSETLATYGGKLGFGGQLREVFDLQEYEEGASFTAAGFDITPVRLLHYKERTFGLRVTDGRATLAYSGDTAPTPSLTELAHGADVFLCEATLKDSEPPEERGHLSADEAVAAFEAAGAKRLIVIHRPDELALDGGIERAYDGLEVDL